VESKRKEILARIGRIEAAITKAREYLDSGKHAEWTGFRPLFVDKKRDGEVLPPHRDWVRNVFLPRYERALEIAWKKLDKVRS
jgi:hypothetical protein